MLHEAAGRGRPAGPYHPGQVPPEVGLEQQSMGELETRGTRRLQFGTSSETVALMLTVVCSVSCLAACYPLYLRLYLTRFPSTHT